MMVFVREWLFFYFAKLKKNKLKTIILFPLPSWHKKENMFTLIKYRGHDFKTKVSYIGSENLTLLYFLLLFLGVVRALL